MKRYHNKLKLLHYTVLIIVLLIGGFSSSAFATTTDELYYSTNQIEYYDPNDTTCSSSSSTTSSTDTSTSSSTGATDQSLIAAGYTAMGASIFGGKFNGSTWVRSTADDNGTSATGPLAGRMAIAELSNSNGKFRAIADLLNLPTNQRDSFGGVPLKSTLDVVLPGGDPNKPVVVEKADRGSGGGPINGVPRAVDLWYETANALGVKDNTVIYVKIASLGGGSTSSGSGTSTSSNCATALSSTSGGSGGNTGGLISTVLAFAWADGHRGSAQKPAYTQAIQGRYQGGNSGNDCGAFVSAAMVKSGYEPNYPGTNTSGQLAWLKANWTLIASPGQADISMLQPGDIGIKPGHVYLWVGTVAGFSGTIAEAAVGSNVAPTAVSLKTNTYDSVNKYYFFRKKGGGVSL